MAENRPDPWEIPTDVGPLPAPSGGQGLAPSQTVVVPGYDVLEEIGRGGMGVVYRACQTSLGRVVALKVIQAEHRRSAELHARFHREVRIAAGLSHPNLVTVYDGGVALSAPFYVMEYLEGIDLDRLVKQFGPLPIGRACDSVCQAASGLQHLHERGLVHRDVKPANLLAAVFPHGTLPAAEARSELARPGAATYHRVVVKILDMGLARWQLMTEADGITDWNAGGSPLLGTVDYMAPEQALDCRRADIRADVYSLGCTFYHLLTARPPFAGGPLTQKLLRHQQEQPPPVNGIRPEVPEELAAVVQRMIAKAPECRYQRPADVIFALEPFCNGIRYDVGGCEAERD
jgi:serine/threonine protein kinase